MSEGYQRFCQCLKARRPVALVSALNVGAAPRHMAVDAQAGVTGSFGHAGADAVAAQLGRESLERGASRRAVIDVQDRRLDLFIDVQWPSPHLIVIGAVHIAIPLVAIAKTLGFRTTVIDSRQAFATTQRFPHADALKPQWPDAALRQMRLDRSTYLVFLSHDEKLDYPALQVALEQDVPYVGALGSRRTHEKRKAALRAEGLDEAQLARIQAPVGLDIGAETPEEIALAVMAEIVKTKNRKP